MTTFPLASAVAPTTFDEVCKHFRIGGTRQAVLRRIADHAPGDKWWCWPGVEKIAYLVERSVGYVRRIIGDFLKMEVLTIRPATDPLNKWRLPEYVLPWKVNARTASIGRAENARRRAAPCAPARTEEGNLKLKEIDRSIDALRSPGEEDEEGAPPAEAPATATVETPPAAPFDIAARAREIHADLYDGFDRRCAEGEWKSGERFYGSVARDQAEGRLTAEQIADAIRRARRPDVRFRAKKFNAEIQRYLRGETPGGLKPPDPKPDPKPTVKPEPEPEPEPTQEEAAEAAALIARVRRGQGPPEPQPEPQRVAVVDPAPLPGPGIGNRPDKPPLDVEVRKADALAKLEAARAAREAATAPTSKLVPMSLAEPQAAAEAPPPPSPGPAPAPPRGSLLRTILGKFRAAPPGPDAHERPESGP